MTKLKNRFISFIKEEDGIGVIEIVLILVVLIGLVILFKRQIKQLLDNVFQEINSQSGEVYEAKRFDNRIFKFDTCVCQCSDICLTGICPYCGGKILPADGGRCRY